VKDRIPLTRLQTLGGLAASTTPRRFRPRTHKCR